MKGFNDVKAQFVSASKDLEEIVSQELASMGQEWKAGAQRDAPKDVGDLVRGITFDAKGTRLEMFSNAFYSAFMEFGTKGKYRPIPGTEAIAAQFKGFKIGTLADMIRALERWVARKGITGVYSVKTRKRTGGAAAILAQNRAAAWAIAMSILKNGVQPHPFFFKQMEVVWPRFVKNVQKRIESRSKVSVILPGDIRRPNITTI